MVKNIYKEDTHIKEIEPYDVLILGGGPAGLTAALYAARYNLSTALIAKAIGGTANLAAEVENWPGFMGAGFELMKKFKEQAEKFGAKFLEEEILKIGKNKDGLFFVELPGKRFVYAGAIIVTLGTEHKKLNVPGEKEYLGKGVSYCATCDGSFFKNKTVAVVGGADSAAMASVYLSNVVKKIYVLYRKPFMSCTPIVFEKLKKMPHVELVPNSVLKKVLGGKKVDRIEIEKIIDDKKEIQEISVEGVFIEVGATPVSDLIKELKIKTNEENYIVTDKEARTNVDGVYAAGDNTNNAFKQMITAAAEGALAAKSAFEYLKLKKK